MPFKSDAQRRFMYSQKPEIAKDWRKKYGPQTNLPERAKKKKGLLNAYKEGGKRMGRS
jgi:hypothetical protein